MRQAGAALLMMEAGIACSDPADLADVPPRLASLIDFARGRSAPDYARADRKLDAAVVATRRLFDRIDVLLLPTAPLLPPALTAGSQALRVAPKSSLNVCEPRPNSGLFALPMTMAPAALMRATTSWRDTSKTLTVSAVLSEGANDAARPTGGTIGPTSPRLRGGSRAGSGRDQSRQLDSHRIVYRHQIDRPGGFVHRAERRQAGRA